MATAFEKISGGTKTHGQKVTYAEFAKIKRERAKEGRDRFYKVKDLETLSKLRRCKSLVKDWEDFSDKGFDWWREMFLMLAPPPEMTVDEWADRYRKIAPEFAAEPGDWKTNRVSCMRAIMQACSPTHPCRRVVLVKPVQGGGTEAAILNTIGHTIDINPRSMLCIFPTLDLAESFSKERLEPMFRMVPRLSDKVAEVSQGPHANANSVKKKRYPGGFLNLAGANSSSGLSSRPVPIVIMDEVDECIRNAGSAGNPTRLLSARTTTFVDKKEIFISSPSNDIEETGIIQMWEDSSQGTLETQCPNPNCEHWQVLEWERMDLDSANLACEKCGQYFPQWKWNRGEAFERWTFANPKHLHTAGFRLSGLNSPWLDWQMDLIDDFKEAKRIAAMGDDSLMRVFVNTKLAKPYRVMGKRVEVDLYNDRREVYECHANSAELPDGVIIITAAVDVQDTYLAYEIVGWGKARESWGIETGEFQGDPRSPKSGVWDQIDHFVYKRIFRYANGQCARVRLVFIDSGGHCTTEVYKYCKLRHPRVFAIKGVGGVGKSMIIGGKIKEKSEGVWLLRLGVDTLKDEFHTRLAIDKPGPGYCHWPMLINGENAAGYDEHYFEQLIAEERILKYTKGGFAKYEWHKNRTDANEALDLRCYNRAALDYLKVRLEQVPKDVLKHFNTATIERVEIGLGRSILVDRSKERNIVHERATQLRRQSTMGGLSNEASDEAPRRTVRDVSAKYGAVTNSF